MSAKKKGPGRPPKPAKERKQPFSVRFSPIELQQVEAAARAEGLGPSVYVHHRALKLI